ncbi:recombinase family protein [Brevundimonas diminuta]|uniref:DNA-invertase hin n=1 Tax=Brevundimonas diminuta TaxID=293 RepID=A0A2X1APH4_BREDI|nr:recombinase family protein [Brevundimonas diminuta]SPU45929.1 DNA-invertase hin [Brevundimonas diminuta]
MAVVGYARVSSIGQSLEVQEEALRAAGCDKVFSEKRTGTTQEGREGLRRALEYVREGDIFVVTRIDRLARSVTDLGEVVAALTTKGVSFRALQQGEFDTTAATGRLFLTMLGPSLSSRPACAASVRWKGSPKQRLRGDTGGDPRPWIKPLSAAFIRKE